MNRYATGFPGPQLVTITGFPGPQRVTIVGDSAATTMPPPLFTSTSVMFGLFGLGVGLYLGWLVGASDVKAFRVAK